MSSLTTSRPTPAAVWTDLDAATDRTPTAGRDTRGRHQGEVSWKVLAHRSLQIASALHAVGVRQGDRISLLVEAGPERTAVAYACWRLGAVVVATAPELTLREEAQAHAAARPQVVVADSRGLLLTRALRTPRLRIATERVPVLDELALGARYHLADLVTRRLLIALPEPPGPDDDAALVFAPSDDEPIGAYYTQSDLGHLRELLEPVVVGRDDPSRIGSSGAVPTRPARAPRSTLRATSARVLAGLALPAFG
ncbi:AMP-binding protein [Cellulomonas soli]|uniref:AMP-binding protein n=1 Tax=Cellulomonas soli TaxID=931535 RepID=UPI003F838838